VSESAWPAVNKKNFIIWTFIILDLRISEMGYRADPEVTFFYFFLFQRVLLSALNKNRKERKHMLLKHLLCFYILHNRQLNIVRF